MISPLVTLLLGLLVLLVVAFFLIRGRTLVSRWTRNRQDAARIQMEDALKHAFDCEEKGVIATLPSIAGALSISTDRAAALVIRLEARGLLHSAQDALSLTPEGRSYALRVVRMHRLWERYLADETSVRESDWHREAEKQEHHLTPDQADALAAQMGNPQLDPHGDPIPSASGELPSLSGDSLSSMPDGTSALIVHVEDEPIAVYAQLAALGLHPGMQIRLIESSAARIRLEVGGEEIVLAPLLARNITVRPTPEGERIRGPFRTLASLETGVRGTVLAISRACRGAQRRRLMDLGIVPGTEIVPELNSLTGDPVAYVVRGTLVALRRSQAEQIFVRPVDVP